ncbi:MAG: flavodoxin-dependent (E)-4-hydroxy-3-methylbut-2-enyl-diphosphate synthase [Lachnospiraceae bacterium]|nr:flavodoxin-dependent (E)-4-hydroxy-3-methylbut-2-enyl-diphosphate synthase [Lachnospiraceae bacterium]
MITREQTNKVMVGSVPIGGGSPIAVQSMTNTQTQDVTSTVTQILSLEEAGCEIIRLAVPDQEAAVSFGEIKKQVHLPMVADIHFDWRLALAAIEAGADAIRINPGNIGEDERLIKVVRKAKEYRVPIRVGVNSGSLEKRYLKRDGGVTAQGLAQSALDKVALIEQMDFDQIVVSVKSTDVPMCIRAHEMIAQTCAYPLHIGITEAGTPFRGTVKSAAGLGILLWEGLGDTLRISLTGDPVQEVKAAKLLLEALDLRRQGIEVVSCPTCGRTQIDLITLAQQVETLAAGYDYPIKIAVMGCVVNGPGEAKEADLGIAGGRGEGLLIKKGEIVKKLPEGELLAALKDELDHWEG